MNSKCLSHQSGAAQHQHIFPVLKGSLSHEIEYNLGAGIGLTPGPDRDIEKFNLKLEHFIGALF